MNKVIRVFLIMGFIISLLGVGMITAGAMMGGVSGVGPYFSGSTFWSELGWYVGASHGSYPSDYDTPSGENDVSSGATGREVYQGVDRLEVEVGPGYEVTLVEEARENEEDMAIYISRGNEQKRYSINQEGARLEIEIPKLRRGERMESVTIFVPAGFVFQDLEITVLAGSFYAERLHAQVLSLEANAGRIRIDGGSVGSLEADCRAGELLCMAVVEGNVEADCAAGNVEVQVAKGKNEYNYELDVKTGSITLEDGNPQSYSGLSYQKQIHNQADIDMELDSSAGNITIYYPKDTL